MTATDGTSDVYRCGFDSWTATSFLTQLRHMTRQQPAESAFTGEKLGQDDKLDIISYVNNTSQDNEQSPVVNAQIQVQTNCSRISGSPSKQGVGQVLHK